MKHFIITIGKSFIDIGVVLSIIVALGYLYFGINENSTLFLSISLAIFVITVISSLYFYILLDIRDLLVELTKKKDRQINYNTIETDEIELNKSEEFYNKGIYKD